MEPINIVIMEKNKSNGFLEKEIGSYTIKEAQDYILNAYIVVEEEKYMVHMKVTTEREVEDWEFSAIYDYYDPEVFGDQVAEVLEVEDGYNPTWELIFPWISTEELMEEKMHDLLKIHKNELHEVYQVIAEKKEEYQ